MSFTDATLLVAPRSVPTLSPRRMLNETNLVLALQGYGTNLGGQLPIKLSRKTRANRHRSH